MPTIVQPALFQPLRVGGILLSHRVAMAPMTRLRAHADGTRSNLTVEYYAQRASTPGTLLIAESAGINRSASAATHMPGIWTDEHVAVWKKVVDAVHARGSFIFLQLYASGRAAKLDFVNSGGFPYLSSGTVPIDADTPVPRALTLDEIKEHQGWFARAARLAVEGAGFDGVEIHGAYGFLVDQFTQITANNRTDAYGGSIGNRSRFALEVLDEVVGAVGAPRVALRLSPWEAFRWMREADPVPVFSHLIAQVVARHPDLAYLHVVESVDASGTPRKGESVDFARRLWAPRPLVLASGFTPERARERVEDGERNGENLVIVFGRPFIANPDLPRRIRDGHALASLDPSNLYTPMSAKGYIDYPFVDQASMACREHLEASTFALF